MTMTPTTAHADYAPQVHRLVHHVHKLQLRLRHDRTPYHGHTRFRTWLRWRDHDRFNSRLWSPWTAAWLRQALCVHAHEGAWNDPDAPYWGGMQFGYGEWLRFGGEFAPTADLALPHQQLLAAYRYWQLSGWYPWPNTARACGLI